MLMLLGNVSQIRWGWGVRSAEWLACGDLRSAREDRQTPFGPALISAGPNGWSAGGRDDQATESAGSMLSSLLSAFTMTVTRTVARAISPAPTANATW